MKPLTTIAVCTKNRFNLLEKCLASIDAVVYPKKEIVVVDSSASNLVARIEDLVETYEGRYIHEPRAGLSIARNRAIQASRGDIIAFVGDDCTVDPDWLSFLIRNYSASNVACVTGRILPCSRVEGTLYRDFVKMDFGPNRRVYPKDSVSKRFLKLVSVATATTALGERAPFPWGIGAGDNMSFRREIFETVGLFDLSLWRRYPVEDLDMFIRILNRGYQLIYDPRALVHHEYRLNEKAITIQDLVYMHGVGTGGLLLKYVLDPYFFSIYFGRILNVLYGIFKATLERDRNYSIIRRKYLNGLLYALGLRLCGNL